jgi:hypothetical protein
MTNDPADAEHIAGPLFTDSQAKHHLHLGLEGDRRSEPLEQYAGTADIRRRCAPPVGDIGGPVSDGHGKRVTRSTRQKGASSTGQHVVEYAQVLYRWL